MIEKIEELEPRLTKLAKVVNQFNSEAVQLKVLEFVLGPLTDDTEVETETGSKKKTRRKSKPKPIVSSVKARPNKGNDTTEGKKKTPKRNGSLGPWTAIEKLLEEGFFKTKRTAKDIIEYCKTNKAITLKSNEFSGKLASMTRNNILKRTKNSDKQYEYWQE